MGEGLQDRLDDVVQKDDGLYPCDRVEVGGDQGDGRPQVHSEKHELTSRVGRGFQRARHSTILRDEGYD